MEILASQWWLCLYANVLPTSTLLRVWDSFLAGDTACQVWQVPPPAISPLPVVGSSGDGFDTLVAAALAILRRFESRLNKAEDIAGGENSE